MAFSRASRFRICAWIDRSSAETGSSQTISSGLSDQRAGDADALALSAGELVRIARLGLRRKADPFQHALHRCGPLDRARRRPCTSSGVAEDAADRVTRVERAERILEDHLHAAAKRPHRGLGPERHFDAAECHPAGGDRHQAEERLAEGRLAAAGFADETERLAPGYLEADAVHGTDRRLARRVLDADIGHVEQVHAGTAALTTGQAARRPGATSTSGGGGGARQDATAWSQRGAKRQPGSAAAAAMLPGISFSGAVR